MSGACCLIKSDLSRVIAVNGAGPQVWHASDLGPDDIPTATMLGNRAAAAASWAVGLEGVRKKLSTVCIDVDEIRCRWVRPSGTAGPVVSAALRGLDQDWEQSVLPERVEPLIQEPDGTKGAGGVGAAVAVLCVPDALPRLFLDHLDRRGVRAGEVISLWHAMARAWDNDASGALVCVLLDTGDDRLVWSWSRAGALIVGGSAPMSTRDRAPGAPGDEPGPGAGGSPEERAAKRVALDWLTWSVQVGASPDRIIAVGLGAIRAAGALGEQWNGVEVQHADAERGLEATLTRATRSAGAGGTGNAGAAAARDSRRVLVHLTRRPTRSTRAVFAWGALALLAVAVAAGGLGVRMARGASSIRGVADETIGAARARVLEELPLAESQPSIDLYLQQRIAQLQQGSKFTPPPAPPPIFEEMKRVLEAIRGREGVELVSVVLSNSQTCEMMITVPDTRTGEEITLALNNPSMAASWSLQRGAQSQLVFKGTFR